jgi:hypothetical protein
VTLRDPKTDERVKFDIEPLDIKAKVVFLSRDRWPSGGLPVIVRLFNSGGRPVPDGIDINIEVSVNVDPIQVEWKREGHNLTARLPKPTRGGSPWVVRLDVSSPSGLVLGRDFVELSDGPSADQHKPKDDDRVTAQR